MDVQLPALFCVSSLVACSTTPSPGATDGGAADGQPGIVAISVIDGGDGKPVMTIPLSINGSASVPIALDTGSVGLRIFESALSVPVTETSKAVSATFGGGGSAGNVTWSGVESYGAVTLAGIATSGSIGFELVTAVSCQGNFPCGDPLATNPGIGGIIGVGLRGADDSVGNYSPIAQLPAPWSNGFVIHMSGGAPGQLLLGASEASFGQTNLSADTPAQLPNGLPAWLDGIPVCFAVNGVPIDPPCSTSFIDTGAWSAYVPVQTYPPDVTNGPPTTLQSGASFTARNDAGLDLSFTAEPSASSLAQVEFYSGGYGVASLGLPLFVRVDVAYDILGGHIGFGHLGD